jgi:hypothetical protein
MEVISFSIKEKKGRDGYIRLSLSLLTRLHEDLYQKRLKCHNFPTIYESVVKFALRIREKKGSGGYIKVSFKYVYKIRS